jgi:hypothetical protein
MHGCEGDKPKQVQRPKPVVRKKIPVAEKRAADKAIRRASTEKTRRVETPTTEEKAPQERSEQGAPVKKAEPTGPKPGHYRVGEGESLSTVAGRDQVYGDPRKWPSLYRINMDKLAGLKPREDIHLQQLAKGMDLRFVTPQEAKENLARSAGKQWVVNVFSSPSPTKIVPAVVKLITNGYRVYIARTTVKGKEWMRLRAGFYSDREAAESAGKKIMALLGVEGAWVVKIGEIEQATFAAY